MISLADIQEAAVRIAEQVRHTPTVRCSVLDKAVNAEVFLKCENLQVAGAFKSRGACNAVFSLSEEQASRGVATHSSGNHAAALSRAARRRDIPAYIVMPRTARPQKIAAVRQFGGQITFCEPTLVAREQTATAIIQATGAVFIPPYDDDRIIAGAGTAALELLQRTSDLDVIITPVGGGGLLGGTAVATKSLSPATQVWAGEPNGADDAYRSWQAGQLLPAEHPHSIADGLLTNLGERNFEIIRQLVDRIVLVSDAEIVQAVHMLYELADLAVEPSGAVPLAVLWQHRDRLCGKRIGLILSGGNGSLEE